MAFKIRKEDYPLRTFGVMILSLRIRLTLMYSALVALTVMAFAVVAYYTVSNELSTNLDASLSRVAQSLHSVIKKQQQSVKRPLTPVKKEKRGKGQGADYFEFLRKSSLRDFVGPIPPIDTVESSETDPVWSAVYEHMLLNSSNYLIQVSDRSGRTVWRTENLTVDSLPTYKQFFERGATVIDSRIYSYYMMRGTRYRMVLYQGDVAEVTAAYPADEVDATLRKLFGYLLYALPSTLFISLFAGYILARRSLRPVDVITRSARQITARNLAQRLPMPPTNDEIARLTETLNEMIARLETSFAQIRQFTSDASHELKTPLAILMGELEIAMRKPLSTEEYRATLTSCLEEVERLTSVVQGLLDLSRADTGQFHIDLRPVNLSSMLNDIADDVLILADQQHVDVESSVASGVIVAGDKVRLHQALLNVMENAVKYTPEKGNVWITLSSSGADAVVTVRDTGIGIPADELPFIYDRFYRVDKARSRGTQGAGLGLSIVKWIIDAHKGTIGVSSQEGSGTTFIIRLPLHVDVG